jgi:uncharacterized protein
MLAELLSAAGAALDEAAVTLNRLNVFPVPDGDTGTNLRVTFAAAAEGTGRAGSAHQVARRSAEAALRRATGNSGVIASQWLAGLARALPSTDPVQGEALAVALDAASKAASAAVMRPTDGTILTAMEMAARAAERSGAVSDRLSRAARAAFEAARASQQRLPEARAAGVPDAGALGFAVALDAMARTAMGVPPRPISARYRKLGPAADWRAAARDQHHHFGTCLQLTLTSSLSPSGLRPALEAAGESVLVAGEPPNLRVHLHTLDTAAALATLRDLGTVADIGAADMDLDADAFLEPVARSAVVAIVEGAGWRRLFEEFGAEVVNAPELPSGLAEALSHLRAEAAIVIPNGYIPTAQGREALRRVGRTGYVLACDKPPAGLSALLVFNREEEARVNRHWMREAARLVRTERAETAADVERLARRHQAKASLLSVYHGAAVSEEEARALASRLTPTLRPMDVEVLAGGQSAPAYWLAFEE